MRRRITCHELRHTCFTRLREAGMELEALQAQAGHRSLDTTRLYVHLANGWLAEEYDKATALIDADMFLATAGRDRPMSALPAAVTVERRRSARTSHERASRLAPDRRGRTGAGCDVAALPRPARFVAAAGERDRS